MLVTQVAFDMNSLIDGLRDYLINLKSNSEKKIEADVMPSVMQLNRLKHLLSSRMCEIIYLIQGITRIFQNELLNELPKNYEGKGEKSDKVNKTEIGVYQSSSILTSTGYVEEQPRDASVSLAVNRKLEDEEDKLDLSTNQRQSNNLS